MEQKENGMDQVDFIIDPEDRNALEEVNANKSDASPSNHSMLSHSSDGSYDSSSLERTSKSKSKKKSTGKDLKLRTKQEIVNFFSLNDPDDDAMLFDLNELIAQNAVVSMAPGENKKPIPWLIYPNLDELTFPTIFAGQKFNTNNVSYTNRTKSELRRACRRSCHPDRLFYMAKRKQEEQCFSNINVCLRKVKDTERMTAGNLMKEGAMDDLISHDAGYRVLANIRSSPAYWENKKKELMALVRQLGKPAIFLTLTANEKQCPELLQVLHRFNRNQEITYEEAINLSDNIKTELIRKDPVTCARYFDYKTAKFMKCIKKENSVFENFKVSDSYKRVEFQMRGSPHEHIMLWIDGAPSLDVDNLDESEKKCIEFIDKFITCERDATIPFVSLQNHRHTHTCYKKKGKNKKCRFGIPLPMMRETRILHPLNESEESNRDNGKDNAKKVCCNSIYNFVKQCPFAFYKLLIFRIFLQLIIKGDKTNEGFV